MASLVYDLSGKRVWVAGHRGMVGGALVRRLGRESCELVGIDGEAIDLRRQDAVERWMRRTRPEAVFLAAARVGGILVNGARPGEFLYDNLMIAANVIEAARQTGVERLLFLGSSCIYPKLADQPIVEDALLAGPLEPTNEWYAVAKIAGLKLCQAYRRQYGCDFISAMPTNLYGPGDNFDPLGSHVIPGLIRRADEARRAGATSIEIWGSGKPRREFLYVEDLADALVFLMQRYRGEAPINVGMGHDVAVAELARMVCEAVGFDGALRFDHTKPDGTPRKLLDVSRLAALGWRATVGLQTGLDRTYAWYREHVAAGGGDAGVEESGHRFSRSVS